LIQNTDALVLTERNLIQDNNGNINPVGGPAFLAQDSVLGDNSDVFQFNTNEDAIEKFVPLARHTKPCRWHGKEVCGGAGQGKQS
jgi:hypothetical protein